MSLWRQLARGFRTLLNPSAADQDIADEIDHYLAETTASLQAKGLSAEDARRAARLEVGDATAVREQVRDYGWENVVETTLADVRQSTRRLLRSPLFAVVAVLTLALGIGASTTIFSAVNPILLQSLPYPHAEDLMMIWDGQTAKDITFGTYREVSERNRLFESMAVMKPLQRTLTNNATTEPERLEGQYVSAGYFRVLGVRPAIGRDFQAADDQPNAPPAVIISDTLWRRRFGADSAIIGRQIALDDVPFTVVGIMPAGFENVVSPAAEIWSPLRYDSALPLNGKEWGHHLRLIARVRHGVRLSQARQELNTIARATVATYARAPWATLSNGFIANGLQDDLTGPVKPILFAVMGAVVLLLAIACVNVTNLLLSRSVRYRAELALRAALGASRLRLLRQLLTETLLLSGLGGALGVLLAHAAIGAVMALSLPELLRVHAIHVDGYTLAFTLGITTMIGLVIGVVPALHGFEADVYGGIQQRSARITGGHQFTRRALVVIQVSLAVALLIGAGLLFRSLQHLFAVPPGFNAENLLTMEVQTAGRQFRDPDRTHRFFNQVLEAVRNVPGVSAAAFTSQLPLTGEEDVMGVHFESTPAAAADEGHDGYRYAVSPGYFEAMGIPLRRGRLLNEHDVASAPLAAIINESFASRRLPGLEPIGQRVHVGPDSGPWFTVVGVVANVKQAALSQSRSDAVYVTAAQWRFADNARWLVVRTEGDAAALAPTIRRTIWSVDSNQPVLHVGTMDQKLRASEAGRRFALVLFEAFGIVALVLAAIGTYSLLSGNVNERTREIGVRSALGASRQSIITMVLQQGMRLAGLGMAIGMIVAAIGSRALASLLFGISSMDTMTYTLVIALLAGVSLVACAVPAWRAARVDPSIALQSE